MGRRERWGGPGQAVRPEQHDHEIGEPPPRDEDVDPAGTVPCFVQGADADLRVPPAVPAHLGVSSPRFSSGASWLVARLRLGAGPWLSGKDEAWARES